MERNIMIHGDIVKFYTYRTAMLKSWFAAIILTDADYRYLERKLDKDKHQLDNHIVFSTQDCDFWLTDGKLYIGKGVIEF